MATNRENTPADLANGGLPLGKKSHGKESTGREPTVPPSPPPPNQNPAQDAGLEESAAHNGQPVSDDTAVRSDAELIEIHQNGVWRYLRMLGCDASTADDLTQETFLRVLRRDNFVQHSDAATNGYLRRTAYNLLVSMHRRQTRVHCTPDAATIDEIWDRWAGKDLSGDVAVDTLKDCLTHISERARLALQMRFADQASRLEIAEALGITDHGARNLMQRAKEKLRECVQGRLTPEEGS